MEICKNFTKFIFIFFLSFQSIVFSASFEEIQKLKLSNIDLIIFKLENYLLKNKHKVLSNNPLMVYYQTFNYEIKYFNEEKIDINIRMFMNRSRYTQKKYFPDVIDCNIVRNIIFYDKFGYSAIKRKRNQYVSVEDMNEVLKDNFFNLTNLDDESKDFLIDKTFIEILIIHPQQSKNSSCSGKISDLELK